MKKFSRTKSSRTLNSEVSNNKNYSIDIIVRPRDGKQMTAYRSASPIAAAAALKSAAARANQHKVRRSSSRSLGNSHSTLTTTSLSSGDYSCMFGSRSPSPPPSSRRRTEGRSSSQSRVRRAHNTTRPPRSPSPPHSLHRSKSQQRRRAASKERSRSRKRSTAPPPQRRRSNSRCRVESVHKSRAARRDDKVTRRKSSPSPPQHRRRHMSNLRHPLNDTTRRRQVSPRRRDRRLNGRNPYLRKRSTSMSRAVRDRHSIDDVKQMDRSSPEDPPKARLSQYAVNRLREIVKSVREDRGVASEESVVRSDNELMSSSAESTQNNGLPPPRHNNRLHKEWTDVNGYKGRYVGEVNDDGQPHGRGTMRYNLSGLVYEGEWVNGVRKEETSIARVFNNIVGWNPTSQSSAGVMPSLMNSTNSLMTRSSGSRGDSSMVSNPHHMTMQMHPMMMNTSRIQHPQQRPMQMQPMIMHHAPRMMMDQSITPHRMMIQSQQQQQQQQPTMMQGDGYPPPQAAASMVQMCPQSPSQQVLAPYQQQQQREEIYHQGDHIEVEPPIKPPSPGPPSHSHSHSQKQMVTLKPRTFPPPPYRD